MRMTAHPRLRRAIQAEHGYTLVVAMMVLLVSGLLMTAAFVSAEGDVHLTRTDLSQQRAFDAAQAALEVYEYNLNTNAVYWETCPKTESPAVRKVPGSTEEEYSYETLPNSEHEAKSEKCVGTGKQAAIVLEPKHPATGTFRVEATGTSGGETRKIVAT